MKKEELIKKIMEVVPDGAEVVVFDHRKNLSDDCGDGSSAGIYKDFDVMHHTKKDIAEGSIQFSALYFDNTDYMNDGSPVIDGWTNPKWTPDDKAECVLKLKSGGHEIMTWCEKRGLWHDPEMDFMTIKIEEVEQYLPL